MDTFAEPYRFSANLGFLWKDRPFLERIAAAAAAGFDALEFHDQAQAADAAALGDALASAGLPVLSLNAAMGETAGCAAIQGMEDRARREIDDAIATADRVGARAVHVLSGLTHAREARRCLVGALRHAVDNSDLTILIEPISPAAMPGYFLNSLDLAAGILAETGRSRLKILFDCFHVAAMHGDVEARFRGVAPAVGHVQIASFPGRAEPSAPGLSAGAPAQLDYARLLPAFRAAGYEGAFGCEYVPAAGVEAGLGWRDDLRRRIAGAAAG